jgi:hypothetical protein
MLKWHDFVFKSTPKIMSLHLIQQWQKQVSSSDHLFMYILHHFGCPFPQAYHSVLIFFYGFFQNKIPLVEMKKFFDYQVRIFDEKAYEV